MRMIRVLIALLVTAVGGPAPGGEPGPAPFRGRIVFFGSATTDDPESTLIQAMNPDGSGLETVLKVKGTIEAGRVSPDGRRLAYSLAPPGAKKAEVWTLEPGGACRKVHDEGYVRAWSPEGTKIACISGAPEAWENFTVAVETGQVERIAIPKTDVVEDWSPDGKVFSVMAGNPGTRFEHATKGSYPRRQIYLIRADGSGRVALTAEPADDAIWSRFAPDSGRVAHYRRLYPGRDKPTVETSVVRDRDGSGVKELVRFAVFSDEQYVVRPLGSPCWSPDSKTVVWNVTRQRREGPERSKLNFELVFVPLDGGPARRLVLDSRDHRFWGPIDWR